MRYELSALVGFAAFACGARGSNPLPPVIAPVSPTVVPASVAAAPAPPPSPGAAVETHEMQLIAHMLKRVEEARGLHSTKPIPGVRLERGALIAQVKKHVLRELPPEAIRNEGLALQLLGLVPTEFDYEAAEYRLLEDQLAGYYEPADGTMYMASDLGDEEADATLAHELVHALQDQHWNLQERSKYRPGEGDHSEAVSALAEGDATSAMFDVMIARTAPGSGKTAVDMPDEVFSEQIRQGLSQGSGADAPHIMRSSLVAPYVYGTLFVHALRRRGGWEAVNGAWDHPPSTTEQIIHVDKWLAHEPALVVRAPSFVVLGQGWKVTDEDSEGELGVRVVLEEWMDPARAAEASTGWGGDRGVLLANGDKVAFAWRLRYDANGGKNERHKDGFAAIAQAIDHSLGRASKRDASFDCHERAERGPLAMGMVGSDIVFVAGPAKAVGGKWSSAGTCSLARKWVRELGGTR